MLVSNGYYNGGINLKKRNEEQYEKAFTNKEQLKDETELFNNINWQAIDEVIEKEKQKGKNREKRREACRQNQKELFGFYVMLYALIICSIVEISYNYIFFCRFIFSC